MTEPVACALVAATRPRSVAAMSAAILVAAVGILAGLLAAWLVARRARAEAERQERAIAALNSSFENERSATAAEVSAMAAARDRLAALLDSCRSRSGAATPICSLDYVNRPMPARWRPTAPGARPARARRRRRARARRATRSARAKPPVVVAASAACSSSPSGRSPAAAPSATRST